MTKKIEGDPGTWSHCGDMSAHSPHRHDIVMNEGPYRNILCNGTRSAEASDEKVLANLFRRILRQNDGMSFIELDHAVGQSLTIDTMITLSKDEYDALVRMGAKRCEYHGLFMEEGQHEEL